MQFFQSKRCLLPGIKLFPEEKFSGLKNHFEKKFANLDSTQRPEAMDTPHYIDPALFEWLMAAEVLDLVEQITAPIPSVFSIAFHMQTCICTQDQR